MQETAWLYGGSDVLFPGLTWANRPSMAGSEASEALQRAWVATIMAIQDVLGAVKNGNCFLVAMTAGPLVYILGEPVQPCAGYAGFVERTGRSEYGMRWRPEKWAKWIDASAGKHVSPLQDVQCWLETRTHVIDFTKGDTMGEANDLWPPAYLLAEGPVCAAPHGSTSSWLSIKG